MSDADGEERRVSRTAKLEKNFPALGIIFFTLLAVTIVFLLARTIHTMKTSDTLDYFIGCLSFFTALIGGSVAGYCRNWMRYIYGLLLLFPLGAALVLFAHAIGVFAK